MIGARKTTQNRETTRKLDHDTSSTDAQVDADGTHAQVPQHVAMIAKQAVAPTTEFNVKQTTRAQRLLPIG